MPLPAWNHITSLNLKVFICKKELAVTDLLDSFIYLVI